MAHKRPLDNEAYRFYIKKNHEIFKLKKIIILKTLTYNNLEFVQKPQDVYQKNIHLKSDHNLLKLL